MNTTSHIRNASLPTLRACCVEPDQHHQHNTESIDVERTTYFDVNVLNESIKIRRLQILSSSLEKHRMVSQTWLSRLMRPGVKPALRMSSTFWQARDLVIIVLATHPRTLWASFCPNILRGHFGISPSQYPETQSGCLFPLPSVTLSVISDSARIISLPTLPRG